MTAGLFRLVWTPPSGDVVVSEPTSRVNALDRFDSCRQIRQDACWGRGRLRVLAEDEYQRSRST